MTRSIITLAQTLAQSPNGGRKAAAKTLSRLGVAIKVSSDGGITAYSSRGTRENPEIAFEVCV
jgi:hypothetical protein